MRKSALACLIVLATALPADATEVRATSSTVFGAWKDVRGGETVLSAPIYELLALEVSSTDVAWFERTSLVLRGWARVQLGEDVLDDDDADLQLLFARAENELLTLRVGRQHVIAGVGRMDHIDGLDARVRLPANLELEGWFGALVRPHFDWDGGDRQGGTRLSARLPRTTEVGASYVRSLIGGEVAREEVGLDVSTLLGPVNVIGFGAMDLESASVSDTRLAVRTRVIDSLYVTVDASRSVPALLLPRTSIFRVFSDVAHASFGGDAQYDPSPYYRLQVDGHALRIDGGNQGYRTGLDFTTFREPEHRSAIGVGVSRLEEGDRGYVRGRVWTTLRPGPDVGVSGDAHAYRYDEEINGTAGSLIGQASFWYEFGPRAKVVATARGGTTPYAEYLAEGFVRVLVGFGTDVTKELGP